MVSWHDLNLTEQYLFLTWLPELGSGRGMTFGKLDDFTGYRKALELFDLVIEDTSQHMKSARCERLVSQQIASAGSAVQ